MVDRQIETVKTVTVVQHHTKEVTVAWRPSSVPDFVEVLADLTARVDSGRVYDRDIPALSPRSRPCYGGTRPPTAPCGDRSVSTRPGTALSRDTDPMTQVSRPTKTRWWRFFLAALAAALVALLGAGTASATTLTGVETRVGASTPSTRVLAGVHESVSAGQRWDKAPPQAVSASATGVACFIAGTEILLADGTSKTIENITAGDQVTAYNPATGKNEPRTVVRTYTHHNIPTYNVTLTDGGTVTTTTDHPFWVNNQGWTPTTQLQPGDQLRQPNGTPLTISTVTPTGQTATVHNFEVEQHHNYYVKTGNHWTLVHNMCGTVTNAGPRALPIGP